MEMQYYQQNAKYGLIDDMKNAVPPYIDQSIASKEKTGFYHEIFVESNGKQFNAQARPISYGETGIRTFWIDESGLLRYKDNGESVYVDRSVAETWNPE